MFDTTEWDGAAAGDPMVRMHADIAELSRDDLDGWHSDALSARLTDLLEVRERLEAELARVAARWQLSRAWEADGSLSPVAWLTHRAPVAVADAQRLVKSAKVLNAAPRLAKALHAGSTTATHIAALARVMSPSRRPLLAEHDEVLSRQAERLPIGDFTLVTRRWAAIADDHLAGDHHDVHQPRNTVQTAVTMDGWLDGRFHLDPMAGAELLATLDHLAPPDPLDAPDGARSLSERRGAALADLVGWYHRGSTPSGNPPNLDALVDVATLNGEPPDVAVSRCELEGVGPVTRATLEQLGCSATLRRVVMAGASVILDMGRKTRFATTAQTRAVRLRDSGCIFPSCDRPARWCDIHHVVPFGEGGPTDVDTMCCLCRRHHTLVHTSTWAVVINADGTFTVAHPTRGP